LKRKLLNFNLITNKVRMHVCNPKRGARQRY
jgi:hypothetical protein